jgi:hypothetical protein
MKNDILNHLENPGRLEKLYRSNKIEFKREFNQLYPQMSRSFPADFWNERLNYESDMISWGSKKELLFIVTAVFIAGFLAKFPNLFGIEQEFYYPRNISFIILPILTFFFAWKNKLTLKKTSAITGMILISWIYINILPANPHSDTLVLACIHLPFFLWVLFGISYSDDGQKKFKINLNFLRFNGDVAVMSALLGIAGLFMSGITIGLFELIGLKIEKFYMENVVIFGLPAIPLIATYLTQLNPQLVNKVSPVVAKLFSPAVLIMLVIYLGTIIILEKNPYNDREFLLIFNLLLIGVMALIFFSVAGSTDKNKNKTETWILLLLAIITIIVNFVALSAIIYRISEWGITPNRIAVLGANILILIHLLIVAAKLSKTIQTARALLDVGVSIVKYIPVYFVWVILIVFVLPLLFGFQ